MPVATCFNPDGSQLEYKGKMLEYDRPREERAVLSAKKAWWSRKKTEIAPEFSEPPIGAVIAVDGVPSYRFERVPVFGPDGVDIVATRKDWVHTPSTAKADEEAAALAEMRAKHGLDKPKKAKETA